MQKKKKYYKIREIPALLFELTGVTRQRMTVYQWAKKGVEGHSGRRIHLRTFKRVGHLYTTREWLETFLEGMR